MRTTSRPVAASSDSRPCGGMVRRALRRILPILLMACHLPAAQPTGAELRQELFSAIVAARAAGDWPTAIAAAQRLIALRPDDELRCDLAGLHARAGQADQAMALLAQVAEAGWTDLGYWRRHEDLAAIRPLPRFATLAAQVLANRHRIAVPPAATRAGLRVLPFWPEDGLPGHLYVGDPPQPRHGATLARLVVWLHPSGGSQNGAAIDCAGELSRRGWALLIFPKKDFGGWTDRDGAAALATAQALPPGCGVDAARPVLMGYSAGGQQALATWRSSPPGTLGGLILDAAFDITMRPDGSFSPNPLGPELDRIPTYVLVGGKDPGAKVWRHSEPAWAAAGIPLVVDVVSGAGHSWMMTGAARRRVLDWLGSLP